MRGRSTIYALALLLEPIYESIFLPRSFGFRPGRRAVDCAAEAADKAFRHRHAIDADIEAFFDSVKRRKLLGLLKEQIVDPRALDLIRGILKAGAIEEGNPQVAEGLDVRSGTKVEGGKNKVCGYARQKALPRIKVRLPRF
jgi:retron-type reverse transcriptase